MQPDRVDDVYTHGHHDSVLRSHRWRTAQNSAAYLLPRLQPGMRLLDVGCGPGTLTVDLARHVASGQVVGIDVAPDVVELAQAHARESGAAGANVSFVVGDFRDLPPGSAGFDVVHAHQVLQHLRDPVGALAAMARLLRPGGILAVRDWDCLATIWAPESPGLDRWIEAYRAVTQRNGAEANAGRNLLGWAQGAGLHDASYTTSTWTWATPADRRWWADVWAERTVASSFAEQAVRYGLASADELAAIAEGWRTWAAAPDGVFVAVHGELLVQA
jgi:SAM-dependent methyltransferase